MCLFNPRKEATKRKNCHPDRIKEVGYECSYILTYVQTSMCELRTCPFLSVVTLMEGEGFVIEVWGGAYLGRGKKVTPKLYRRQATAFCVGGIGGDALMAGTETLNFKDTFLRTRHWSGWVFPKERL